MKKLWILLITGAGLAGLILFTGAANVAATATGTTPTAAPDIRRDATVEAVQRVMPGVVNIRTETVVERSDPFDRLAQEFWGPYYRRRATTETSYSLGSGVIIDEEGWVLTNFHVVNRATRVFVRTADGREFEAKGIAGTSFTDLALLKIENPKNEKFHVIRFAADDDLLLGETVLALGNPFGLGGSVSKGILSSKSRRPPLENEPLEIEDWLQSDAAINPGNSGGPLVNLRGELIGINVATFRQGQGIGFAIPIRRVSAAVSEVYSPEIMESLWFGARVKPGIWPLTVRSVQADSPAARADLRAGDQIVQVNGTVPKSFIDFVRRIVASGTKDNTALVIQRAGHRKTIDVQLVAEKSFFSSKLIRTRTGLTVEELTGDDTAVLGIGSTRGAIITDVEANSPAAKAGLKKNMIITAADAQTMWFEGQKAPTYVPLARMIHAKKRGEKVQLDLIVPRRNGRYVQLQPAKVDLTLR